ncbi:MarR family transcriptional regulator [Actinomadura keratinilytica]|uniref:MarR family transcriptional regulator n=2 Tax=Actinomadura keratinilytica TaxID=547461 RepID=A0ABP7ZB52_9ACTN
MDSATPRDLPAEAPAEALAEEVMRLDRQVCFAVHAASRAFDAVYRPLLRELGLTYPQYLAMLALWEHGALTVKELGLALRLDSGTLSPLLKRLESAGLVRRERSSRDERQVTVSLTGPGRELRRRAAAVPLRIMEATGLDERELVALHRSLDRLTAALDTASGRG